MAIVAPTPDAVKLINGSALADVAIAPFIASAACIAAQVEASMIAKLISAGCQTSVITWLAAHLMASAGIEDSSRVKSTEKFENYSVEWAQSQVMGQGVLSSTYGATANTLSGGCLQETDKRSFQMLGFGGA